MKKLLLAFALVACFAVSALSQGSPPWTIQEIDGSPRVNSPTLIKVTNGTLSCTGKTCTITISGGGGGSPGGSSTQVQYNAAGSFGGISGFTSDGTNVTAGSGNLRATRPRFITSIDDTNGNEVFVITATGSAVNEFTIANAATGNNPTITASGGDANVGINFIPKGSGTIQVSGVPIVTTTATQTLTNKTYDTAGTGNVFRINGTQITDIAGDTGVVATVTGATSNGNCAEWDANGNLQDSGAACGGGGGGGITVGTTTITSGTSGRVGYNNAGVYGEYPVTGTAGNVVLSTSPTITTPAITTSATITRDAIGTASSTGFELTNTTAAAAGAQQFSPCAILTSQGWKTASTAASQSTNWCIQNQAVQGSANPTTDLVFSSQINGGGFTKQFAMGLIAGTTQYAYRFGFDDTTGIDGGGAAGNIGLVVSNIRRVNLRYSDNSFTFGAPIQLSWSSGNTAGGLGDTIMRRNGAPASLAFGAADAASPVAQTLSVQNVVGGTTNTAGVTTTIRGSLGTSQGVPGRIHLQGGALIAASGTTQQTAIDRLVTGASKVLTNNSAITIANVTAGSNTSVGGRINYCVEVEDGTDVQYECGSATYGVSNKGGVFSGNTVTKFGNHQNATSGTLTVTFAISGANPALLSVNANSSLTPSTGFPRIAYSLQNLGQQAVAIQ